MSVGFFFLYSSYSCRQGEARLALRLKVPSELFQLHEDWLSDAYLDFDKLLVYLWHKLFLFGVLQLVRKNDMVDF